MALSEVVKDALFGKPDAVEVGFLVADECVGVGEDVINFVFVGLKTNQVDFFAVILLGGDETVDEVPSLCIANGED